MAAERESSDCRLCPVSTVTQTHSRSWLLLGLEGMTLGRMLKVGTEVLIVLVSEQVNHVARIEEKSQTRKQIKVLTSGILENIREGRVWED